MAEVVKFDTAERAADARDLAVRVLDFVGRDDARLARFLRSTGLTKDQVRESARATPLFHLGVLDHVMKDQHTKNELERDENISEAKLQSAAKELAPKREGKGDSKGKATSASKDGLPSLVRRSLYVDG